MFFLRHKEELYTVLFLCFTVISSWRFIWTILQLLSHIFFLLWSSCLCCGAAGCHVCWYPPLTEWVAVGVFVWRPDWTPPQPGFLCSASFFLAASLWHTNTPQPDLVSEKTGMHKWSLWTSEHFVCSFTRLFYSFYTSSSFAASPLLHREAENNGVSAGLNFLVRLQPGLLLWGKKQLITDKLLSPAVG